MFSAEDSAQRVRDLVTRANRRSPRNCTHDGPYVDHSRMRLSVDEVHVIRDEIRGLVTELVHGMGWARETRPRPQLVPTITG